MATKNMQALAEVVTSLPSNLENLHLTFVLPDGTATFASDNAETLRDWWLVQCAKLGNRERKGFWIVLNKREFTTLKDTATGLPIKRLSSCLFRDGNATKLSADETRHAFNTDAATGEALPARTDIVFVDFQ
jgi:hypothetical protein